MDLSVVIPTLNGRDRLAASLDSLAERAPDAEVIVVNGPSADGTTGMVRDRDDVDVLVEISDRSVNVARNAGIEVATGDVIAMLGYYLRVQDGWVDAIEAGMEQAPVVTGPTRRAVRAGVTPDEIEERTIAGRHVTYFDGRNVAFRPDVLRRDLDGFDEYLDTGGSRDTAHRLAGQNHPVEWVDGMAVTTQQPIEADGGEADRDWRWKYRSLAYRLVKNYGPRPTVVRRTLAHAADDATSAAHEVLRGEGLPSAWFANGRDVVAGIARGGADGLVARARDRTPARNPHGLSKRADRAVAMYDWR